MIETFDFGIYQGMYYFMKIDPFFENWSIFLKIDPSCSFSGTLVHSMVAHLDAVTSVTIDPNGLYLLSGSHDASIRWEIILQPLENPRSIS